MRHAPDVHLIATCSIDRKLKSFELFRPTRDVTDPAWVEGGWVELVHFRVTT